MVRIGLLGAGFAARERHLPGLQDVQEAEVKVIWSRSRERAAAVAREQGIPSISETWEDVVKSPEVDAVIVATPPVMHAEITLAALESGKHVLCQGRMCRNLAEARQMERAAEKTDRVTCLYPPRPGLKGDRTVIRLLEEGYVGDIREVRITSMSHTENPYTYDWRYDPDVRGVGAMTMGMWAEVLHRWVGTAKELSAFSRVVYDRQLPTGERAEGIVPNSVSITAELNCGALASYHFSNTTPVAPGDSIEIIGSKGFLCYHLFRDELYGRPGPENSMEAVPIPEEEERKQTTDREFVEAILVRRPVSPSFQDGVRYMAFCEAVAASCHTGERITLDDIEPMMFCWSSPFQGHSVRE